MNRETDKLYQLPIEKLLSITPFNNDKETTQRASKCIIDREKEVISYLNTKTPLDLIDCAIYNSNLYNPTIISVLKKVFIQRKKEIFKQLTLMDSAIECTKETIKEMEEALRQNIEWPSKTQQIQLGLDSIEDDRGWFKGIFRKYGNNQLKKIVNKPPKKLSELDRKILEEQIKKDKNSVSNWKKSLRLKIIELLKQ